MSDPPAPRAGAARSGRLIAGAVVGAALGLLLRAPAGAIPAGGPLGILRRALLSVFGVRFPVPALIAIAIWLAFSLYWQWAARGASRARRSESRASRLVHVAVLSAGQLLVLLPVPGLRARFVPDSWPVAALGLALAAAAFALGVWARRTLGRHWSAEVTLKVGHELVTGGPYAAVRHPIYSAMLLLCAGTTLAWGELHGLVGTALVLVAFLRKIGLEERTMADAFGPDWDAYRARTRLLVPGLL